MTLDEMSIGDLRELRLDLGMILVAAEQLVDLVGFKDGVRIRLQPGETVSITAPWKMPACGGCEYAGDIGPVVIEDAPDVDQANGMVGGSGDLQRHSLAESPPAEPAASTPETGESPVVPAGDESHLASVGRPSPEPEQAAGTVAGDANPNAWSPDDEQRLVEAVAEKLAAGDTRRAAVAHGAALIGRTAAASDFRLRRKLAEQLAEAIRLRVEAAQPEPAPVTAPAVVGVVPPVQADPGLTAAQREIAAALALVPARKGFDVELDLEVVEGHARGLKTDAVALDLDLDGREVLTRMMELTACIRDQRGNLSINGQEDLMHVMRHRVKEARGAVQ